MPGNDNNQLTDTFGNVMSGIQVGGNVLSTALGIPFQLQQNRLNRNFSREMASKQYERQVELWNMQNEYNSPAAQMQRLVDAGLNPYMAQGSGGLGNGLGAPSVPSADGAFSNGLLPKFPDVTAPLQQKLLNAQIRNLESQTDRRDELLPWEVKLKAATLNVSEHEVYRLVQLVKESEKNIEESDARIRNLDEKTKAMAIENYVNDALKDSRIEATMAEFGMTKDKAAKFQEILASSIAQAYGSAHQSEAAAARMKAMTHAEVRLTNALAAYYINVSNKTLTEGKILELERALKEEFGDAEIVSRIFNNLTSGNYLKTLGGFIKSNFDEQGHLIRD